MIETKTTWEDSGYVCDHCGGEILKRTDYESGQPKRVGGFAVLRLLIPLAIIPFVSVPTVRFGREQAWR